MKYYSVMIATLIVAGSAWAAPIGIVNGDFEADAADDINAPAGWTDLSTTASFWTGVIDETGNPEAAEAATAPAPGLGSYFLTTARQSTDPITGSQPVDGLLVQTVDLSSFGTDIDVGDQTLNVDFIWASDDSRDTGTFSVDFFSSTDGSGASLGSVYSVAMDAGSAYDFTGWQEELISGLVPVGARSVTLAIATTRTGGSETNIWIDNIEGSVIPEPATIGLIGVFGAGLLVVRRRFQI